MLSNALMHDFLYRRTKRKRRSNGDSFDEGDVSSYEEEEENAHNHHLDDSGIGRLVEQLPYLVNISPRVTITGNCAIISVQHTLCFILNF